MKPPKAAARWWRWVHMGIHFYMGPDYFVRIAPMFFRPTFKPPANDNGWLV